MKRASKIKIKRRPGMKYDITRTRMTLAITIPTFATLLFATLTFFNGKINIVDASFLGGTNHYFTPWNEPTQSNHIPQNNYRQQIIMQAIQHKRRQKVGPLFSLFLAQKNEQFLMQSSIIQPVIQNKFNTRNIRSSTTVLSASLRAMMDNDNSNGNYNNRNNNNNSDNAKGTMNFDISNLEQRRKLIAQLNSLSAQEIKRELEGTYGVSTAAIRGKESLVSALVMARLTGNLNVPPPITSDDIAAAAAVNSAADYNSFGGGYSDSFNMPSNNAVSAEASAAAAAANAASGTIDGNRVFARNPSSMSEGDNTGAPTPFFASEEGSSQNTPPVMSPQETTFSGKESNNAYDNDYSAQQQNQEQSRDRAKLRQLQIAFEFERIESSLPTPEEIQAELAAKFYIEPKYFLGVKEMAYALAVARVDFAIEKQKQRREAAGGVGDDGCEVIEDDYSHNDISQHTILSPECIPAENDFFPPTRAELIAMEYEHLQVLDETDLEWELENEYGISAKHFLGKKEMAYALAVERVDQAEKEGGFVFDYEEDAEVNIEIDTDMEVDNDGGNAVMTEDAMMRMMEEELRREQEQMAALEESVMGRVDEMSIDEDLNNGARIRPGPGGSERKDIKTGFGNLFGARQATGNDADSVNFSPPSQQGKKTIPRPDFVVPSASTASLKDIVNRPRPPRQSAPSPGKTFQQQQTELQRLQEQQQDLLKKRQLHEQHEHQRELRTKQRLSRQEEELQRRRQQNSVQTGIPTGTSGGDQRMGSEIGGVTGARKPDTQQQRKPQPLSPQEVVRAQANESKRQPPIQQNKRSSSTQQVSPSLSDVLKGTSERQKARTQSTTPPPRPQPRQRPPRSASKTSSSFNDPFGVSAWNQNKGMGNFSQNNADNVYRGPPPPNVRPFNGPFEPSPFTGPFAGRVPPRPQQERPFEPAPFTGNVPPRPNQQRPFEPAPFTGRVPPRPNQQRPNNNQRPFEPAPFTGRVPPRPSKGQVNANSQRPFEPAPFTGPRIHKIPKNETRRPSAARPSSNPRSRHVHDDYAAQPRPFSGSQPHVVEDNRASPPPPVQPPPPGEKAYKRSSDRPFEPAPFSGPRHQPIYDDMPPPPRNEQRNQQKRPFEPAPWSASPFAANAQFPNKSPPPPRRNGNGWDGGAGNMNNPPPSSYQREKGSQNGGASPFDRMRDMFKNMATGAKEPAQNNEKDRGKVEVVPPDEEWSSFERKGEQQNYQKWQQQKAMAMEAEVITEDGPAMQEMERPQPKSKHQQLKDDWNWKGGPKSPEFTTIPSPGGDMTDAVRKAQHMLANPKIRAIVNKAQSNPKVREAVQECMGNPAAFGKYLNDEEVGPMLKELKDCI